MATGNIVSIGISIGSWREALARSIGVWHQDSPSPPAFVSRKRDSLPPSLILVMARHSRVLRQPPRGLVAWTTYYFQICKGFMLMLPLLLLLP